MLNFFIIYIISVQYVSVTSSAWTIKPPPRPNLFWKYLLRGDQSIEEYSSCSATWARAVLVVNSKLFSEPVLLPNKCDHLRDILNSLTDIKADHNVLVDIGAEDALTGVIEDIDRFDTQRVVYLFRMLKGPNGKVPSFNRSSAIKIIKHNWHSKSPICLAFTSHSVGKEVAYNSEHIELVRELEKTVFRDYTKYIELDVVLFSHMRLADAQEFANIMPTIILASDKGRLEAYVNRPNLNRNIEKIGSHRFLFDVSLELYNSMRIMEQRGAAIRFTELTKFVHFLLAFLFYRIQ